MDDDHHGGDFVLIMIYVSFYVVLPDDRPCADIHTAPFSMFLPTKEDCTDLTSDFVELIMRVLVEHIPELQQHKSLVKSHITHKHSSETSKKSEIVSG